jgi:hypothetical protein
LFVVNNNYNYNWNLQVYVTNQKGEEFLLANEFEDLPKVKPTSVHNDLNPKAVTALSDSN